MSNNDGYGGKELEQFDPVISMPTNSRDPLNKTSGSSSQIAFITQEEHVPSIQDDNADADQSYVGSTYEAFDGGMEADTPSLVHLQDPQSSWNRSHRRTNLRDTETDSGSSRTKRETSSVWRAASISSSEYSFGASTLPPPYAEWV